MNSLDRPLTVVAVGGHVLSPLGAGGDLATERTQVRHVAAALAALAERGARLLVVHGNGPQAGRLLAAADDEAGALDIVVAESQGELGYLLAQGLELEGAGAVAAVMTRVVVDAEDPAFAEPTKPIGPVLDAPLDGAPCGEVSPGGGYRRLVPSPKPGIVLEEAAIRVLIEKHHVVCGGGGGVPIGQDGAPQAAVVDKDYVAANLARTFDAARLVFVTNVAAVCTDFGAPGESPLARLGVADAELLVASDTLGTGSMGPKVEAAAAFAADTGRSAVICDLGGLREAMDGRAGTVIEPD